MHDTGIEIIKILHISGIKTSLYETRREMYV